MYELLLFRVNAVMLHGVAHGVEDLEFVVYLRVGEKSYGKICL